MKNHLFLLIKKFWLFFLLPLNVLFSQEGDCQCYGTNTWKSRLITVNQNDFPYNTILKLEFYRDNALYKNLNYGTGLLLSDQVILISRHSIAGGKRVIDRINLKVANRDVLLNNSDYKVKYYKKRYTIGDDIALIIIKNRDKMFNFHEYMEVGTQRDTDFKSLIHLTGFPCFYEDYLVQADREISLRNLRFDRERNQIIYPLFTCDGDSGGPLWTKDYGRFLVFGLHYGCYKQDGLNCTDYNSSVYINERVREWILQEVNALKL